MMVLLLCIPMARSIRPAMRAEAVKTDDEKKVPLPKGWALLAGLAGATFLALEVVAARVAAKLLMRQYQVLPPCSLALLPVEVCSATSLRSEQSHASHRARCVKNPKPYNLQPTP